MYQRGVGENSGSLDLTQTLPVNISPTFTQIVAFDVQVLAEITPDHLCPRLQRDLPKRNAVENAFTSLCKAGLLAFDFKAMFIQAANYARYKYYCREIPAIDSVHEPTISR